MTRVMKSYSFKELTEIGREKFGLDNTWYCFGADARGAKLFFTLGQKDNDGNWVKEGEEYRGVVSLYPEPTSQETDSNSSDEVKRLHLELEVARAEKDALQAKWEAQGLMIQKLHEENKRLECALSSCKYHAERIIERDYGESMDAESIVEEVNEILDKDS